MRYIYISIDIYVRLLAKYGAHEELFSSWNKRLHVIGSGLGIDMSSEIFNPENDRDLFFQDITYLKQNLPEIVNGNTKYQNAIYKRLCKQESNALQKLKIAESLAGHKIEFKNITYSAVLGAGAYGQVFKANYNDQDFAIKKIQIRTTDPKELAVLKNESDIMQKLCHVRIGGMDGERHVLYDARILVIFHKTHFSPNGSLYDLIKGSVFSGFVRVHTIQVEY